MEKFLAGILVISVMFVIGIFSTILATHIALDVASMYSLSWITSNVTFWQLFGLIMVVRIVRPSTPNSNDEKDIPFWDQMGRAFMKQITYIIFYLLMWGTAGLVAGFVF
jgi:hypothetical protein